MSGTANIKWMMNWFLKMTVQKYQNQENGYGPVPELEAVFSAMEQCCNCLLYTSECTPERGVILATGTPVSNSICEMYVMQRYLQSDKLSRMGLQQFDAWADVSYTHLDVYKRQT